VTTFEQATALARYARAVVREALGGPTATAPHGGAFDEPGAAFVSLHWVGGQLQGCIGSLEPKRPLAADVAKNARAAALDDPRARMLSLDEVDALDVEVGRSSRSTPTTRRRHARSSGRARTASSSCGASIARRSSRRCGTISATCGRSSRS
jgi:AMMECR1 domain-containing protein